MALKLLSGQKDNYEGADGFGEAKNTTTNLSEKEEDYKYFESFFSNVYQDNFQALYNYGMHLCGNSVLVKDSIQDIFSELWGKKKMMTHIKLFKPYLLTALRRRVFDEFKKKKRDLVSDFQFEISHEMRIIKEADDINEERALKSAINKLTSRQREAIFLYFYHQLSYKETATILKVNTKAVYKLISRALAVLKLELDHLK